MLAKGTILAGYRIDGLLGQGGMGAVYQATQLSLNRTVALKLLAAHLGEDLQFRERFRREGQIQAAIDHPHIVTVHEAGETEHGLFLAMQLIRGPTLKDMIVSRELDAGRSLRILTPIADALDTAHHAGLIHRDIKPQNILVGGRDHAFLADFGLTKARGETGLTKTGQFVGTLDYVSPEQVRGDAATSRSDIYALAAVLYECLSGVVPFPKESEAAVLFAHMSDPPPLLTDERPELGEALDGVIAKAMAKDPTERYATATELMRAAEEGFGRRVRAALTPPGPIETPEETGIRPAEGKVPTREASTQDSTQLAAAAGTAAQTTARSPSGDTAGAPVAATREAPGAARTRTAPAGAPTPTKGATTARLPSRDGRPAGLVPAVAAILLLLAAIGAFLIGRGSGSGDAAPTADNVATAGALELGFPAGWSRLDNPPEIPGLRLSDGIELGPTGAGGRNGLVAGMAVPGGATLLPASFERQLDRAPSRDDAVRLGDLEAYRYRSLRVDGFDRSLTAYAAPTTSGAAIVACFAGTAAAEFEPECEEVAGNLALGRGTEAVPLGPDEAFASRLERVLRKLNSARTRGRRKLKAATTANGQAGSASSVADAYGNARRALAKEPAGPIERRKNAAIRAEMRRAQTNYDKMAEAARTNQAGRYNSASSAVRKAESRLQNTIRSLRSLGYEIG